MNGDAIAEGNFGRLNGAEVVGGEDGVDTLFPSPVAELFRLLAAFG